MAAYFQNWKWTMDSNGFPIIWDLSDFPIASLQPCSEDKALIRAALIASTPGLYDTLKSALDVFRVIAEKDVGPASLAARDMIPSLESALAAANFMGPIEPDQLLGS
jgi:hypothetical protein